MTECISDYVPGIETQIIGNSVTVNIRYQRHQSTVAASVCWKFYHLRAKNKQRKQA